MTRALLSSIALVAAMTLSSGAMAQTMVGGHDVSADDLPKVQKWCDDLAVSQTNSTASPDQSSEDEKADENSPDTPQTTDAAASDADGATGIDQATTSFDISTITLDQCKEAGLTK